MAKEGIWLVDSSQGVHSWSEGSYDVVCILQSQHRSASVMSRMTSHGVSIAQTLLTRIILVSWLRSPTLGQAPGQRYECGSGAGEGGLCACTIGPRQVIVPAQ